MEILTAKPLSEVAFSTATLSHTMNLPFEGIYYLVNDPRLEKDAKSDSAETAAKLVLGKHPLLEAMKRTARVVADPDIYLDYPHSRQTGAVKTSEFSFSGVNNKSKYTEDCWHCSTELLLGNTPAGKKVSSLLHTLPAPFYKGLLDNPGLLHRVLLGCLKQFQEQTIPGSQIALMAGGMYDDHRIEYLRMIRILSTANQALFGIDTFVLPPKQWYGQTNIYWNQRRNLAVVIEVKWGERPVSERFDPSHLERVKCNWNSLVT